MALAQPLTERVEHAVEIPHNARISIMNFAGHVEVHGTDPGEDSTLRVIGVKRLEAELPAEEAERIFEQVNLDLRRRGRRIHIGPNRPRGDRGRSSGDRRESPPITEVRPPRRIPPVSVDLEVWLPDGASLEVRTFTAPITIAGIGAPDGDFLLRSVSGPIEIRDLEADDLRAETVSGNLTLADVRAHRGSFMTLTAPIRVTGALQLDGWYEFQTHSGAVLLGLGSLAGFTVAATTYSGEIRSDLDFEAERGRSQPGGPARLGRTPDQRQHLRRLHPPRPGGRRLPRRGALVTRGQKAGRRARPGRESPARSPCPSRRAGGAPTRR